MKQRALRHAVTLFVCTRDRGKKDDCCARFGGEKVLAQIKKRIKERKLQDIVRVYPSGCIDKCSKGPNVMVYPGNVWACKVDGHDVDALLDEALERAEADVKKGK